MMAILAASVVFHLTKDTPKVYESFATINTGLVSGYSLEANSGKKIDFGYANYEMENIMSIAKSRATQEEVAERLLANALMQVKPSIEIIEPAAFNDLKKNIPQNIRNQTVDNLSFEKTLANVQAWNKRLDDNEIKTILGGKNPYFGIEHIQTLVIKREDKNSDAIRMIYSTNDPAICRNTLITLIEVFQAKYRTIKDGQSADVVDFFEKATQEAAGTLNHREDNMLAFMEQNKIINYYEQTRFIAAKKEDLDEMYFKETMQLAAADSARRSLEDQLSKYVNLPIINQSILKQRENLSKVASRLANLEISAFDETSEEPTEDHDMRLLQKQTENIKKELRKQADATYSTIHTPEGGEIKNILSLWLNHTVEVEQSLARLTVFKGRKVEFDRLYGKFAPWGSSIKRLERSLDVAEKAYLENLHSFNQARLHRYNTLMTANLSVIDAPLYPDKPKPSSRGMLVAVGFLVGFILPLAVLLALYLLDSSLRNLERAAEVIGLEVSAAFPKLPLKWQSHPSIDYIATMRRATNQLLQSINITLHEQGKSKTDPLSIVVVSTRSGEGKTMVMERLSSHFKRNNLDNVVFTELPPLLSEDYSSDILGEPDIILLVCHADSTWNNADKKAITAVSKMAQKPCHLVLNGVKIDHLESSLGEIPKKRSRMRRWFKQVISMNLTKSSKKRAAEDETL